MSLVITGAHCFRTGARPTCSSTAASSSSRRSEGRDDHRRRRPDRAARPRRPAHAPPRTRLRAERDGADRVARGRGRRLHGGARHGEHLARRRHRGRRRAGAVARRAARLRDRASDRRRDDGPRGRAPQRDRRDGRIAREGARVLGRRQVRLGCAAHAPRARVRQDLRRGDRPARAGAAPHRGRADERGRALGRAGPRRLARGRGGGDHRAGRAARRITSAPACTSATSRPPVVSRWCAGRRHAASTSPPRSRRITCC